MGRCWSKPRDALRGSSPSGTRLGELGLSSLEKRKLWGTSKTPKGLQESWRGTLVKALKCQDVGMALNKTMAPLD